MVHTDRIPLYPRLPRVISFTNPTMESGIKPLLASARNMRSALRRIPGNMVAYRLRCRSYATSTSKSKASNGFPPIGSTGNRISNLSSNPAPSRFQYREIATGVQEQRPSSKPFAHETMDTHANSSVTVNTTSSTETVTLAGTITNLTQTQGNKTIETVALLL